MRTKNNKNAGIAVALAFCLCISEPVSSEVVFDGSLGPLGSLSGDMVITDSFGQQVGSNLFHSFLTFNVNLGETATFTAASMTPIDNVIARVTGSSFSTIDGELGSTIPGASLWLINPNGVLFGENATLNVSGSFHATTADYLTLADGGRFGADLSIAENTMLTIANPSSFGFVDANIAPILVQNSLLTVPVGAALSLVGGDIQISSGLRGLVAAPGGELNITSVAAAGEALIGAGGVDVSMFADLGNILLADGFLSVTETNGAGSIFIRGGNLVVDNSFIDSRTLFGNSGDFVIEAVGDALINGSLLLSRSLDVGLPSDIQIIAGGDLIVANGSQVVTQTDFLADAGDIFLNAANIVVVEQSRVSSSTGSAGDAGDIFATATGSITIFDSLGALDFATSAGITTQSFSEFEAGNSGDIFLSADTLAVSAGLISSESANPLSFGAAGDIFIDVGEIDMSNEALVTSSSRGFGQGGSIIASASRQITLTNAFTALASTSGGLGDSGPVAIMTPALTLSDGALVQTTTFGPANGGDILLNVGSLILSNGQVNADASLSSSGAAGSISIFASESVLLDNPADDPLFRPRISSTTFGVGNAGSISIATPDLTIDNGGIDSNTLATFAGPIPGAGDAGFIDIDVGDLTLVNGGVIGSDTVTEGAGGFIDIDVANSLVVSGESIGFGGGTIISQLSTSASGPGDAGSIDISTDSLLVEDEGAISAFTAFDSGQGGSINISARDIRLDNNGSIITASVASTGNAGGITISTSMLEMFAGSDILTSSSQSAGGNVDIQATNLVYLVDSRIESAADGVTPTDGGGNVTINRPEFFVLNSSLISASANAGNGGNITIATDAFIGSSDSIVTATSNTGVDGVITIESPNDVTGSIVDLTAEIFDADVILTDECTPRASRERSTFTVDRGTTPPRPDAFLSAIESITRETTGHIDHLTEGPVEHLYAIRSDGCGS